MASLLSPGTGLDDNQGHVSDWEREDHVVKRRRTNPTSNPQPPVREIGIMRETQPDGSATFLGSSSGIHFIRKVHSAFARRSADLYRARITKESLVPGEDDQLQRSAGHSRQVEKLCSRVELQLNTDLSFSFDDMVHWSQSYFQNWHPMFPFLHAPSILQMMERASEGGLKVLSPNIQAILRSIFTISVIDRRQTQNSAMVVGLVPAVLVYRTAQEAMENIHNLLLEPSTVTSLQAVLSVQLVLTSVLRLNAASRLGGLITRTVFHLGLHRCPKRFSCFSLEDAEMRQRIFWSVYCLERYLSQALGTPLTIQDDDIDVCYPGNKRHDKKAVVPQAKCIPMNMRLLTYLAKFARVRGLILELRNKSIMHSHQDPSQAAYVSGELAEWWNYVYDDVYPMEDLVQEGIDNERLLPLYHRLLLIVHRHEAIIAMHRPLLAGGEISPDYKTALQICIESSRSVLTALKKYLVSQSVRSENPESMISGAGQSPMSWSSFTWAVWMACLIIMYAASEYVFPTPAALKYAKLGLSVLENLSLRRSSWPETFIDAIRGMESALKKDQSSDSRSSGQPGSRLISSQRRQHASPSEELLDTDPNAHRDQGPNMSDITLGSNLSIKPLGAQTTASAGLQNACSINGPSYEDLQAPENLLTFLAEADNGLYDLTPANLIFRDNIVPDMHQPVTSVEASEDLTNSNLLEATSLWAIADGPWMIHEGFQ